MSEIDIERLNKAKQGRGYSSGGYNLAQLRSYAKKYTGIKRGEIDKADRIKLYNILIEILNVDISTLVKNLDIGKNETPIEVDWFISLVTQSYPWELDGEEVEYEVIRPFPGLLCEMVDTQNKNSNPYPMVVIDPLSEDEEAPYGVQVDTATIMPISFDDKIVEDAKGIVIQEDDVITIYLDYSTGKWFSNEYMDYDIVFGKESSTFKSLNSQYKYIWEQKRKQNTRSGRYVRRYKK